MTEAQRITYPMDTPADMAAAALDLARKGVPVFPCDATKKPLTRNGFKDATTEKAAVAAFWANHPQALIGVPTGAASGLYVVDCDVDKATGETLGENTLCVLGFHDLIAATPGCITQSGGLHLYFRHPGAGFGNTAKRIGPGVDTRGDGGYVIVPPSRTAGGQYRPRGNLDLSSLPELPERLRRMLTAPAAPKIDTGPGATDKWADAALRNELSGLLAAAEGQRNHALNRAAFALGQIVAGGGLPEATVRDRLAAAAAGIGLEAAEIAKTINSGLAAGMVRPRGPKDRKPQAKSGSTIINPAFAAQAQGFKADWPEADLRLLRPDVADPPTLPLREVLSPRAADWVAATAEGAGAPADYVLVALLSVIGALMGNARWVSPWRGWAEPPVIWGMCIGNPSAGKSPAIDAVLAPLRRAEVPLRRAAEAEVAAWEARQKLARLAEADWERRAKAAIAKGNPAPALPESANAGTAPHVPRLVVNDGTVERLGVIMAAQPKGFLQFRDELAGWLLAMEARNNGSDRAFWLEAYGGRAFTVERMGRPPLTVPRLMIGALGGIQPDRLRDLLTKASDDGLLARFLPVWPARVPIRQPDRLASDALADAAMARLMAMQMPVGEDGDLRPWFVGFDDAACDMMNDWREACAAWEQDAEGLMLSFIGKLPGLAARLSLVLSGLDHAFDDAPDPAQRQITPATFGRACHLVESYVLPMARRAYGAGGGTKAERAARALAFLIRAEGWQRFTAREVRRLERRGLAAMAEINPAIASLEEADLIRAIDETPGPQGGRAKRLFAVNPALHEAEP